jgi:hypothetical protein
MLVIDFFNGLQDFLNGLQVLAFAGVLGLETGHDFGCFHISFRYLFSNGLQR